MRKGEIWCDIEDGSKVRIRNIKYNEAYHDELVFLETYPDGNEGFVTPRQDFLKQYEKFS